ncbi:MAG: hypothetical protein NZ585_11585 [Chloracidobacterium sp.]|nr:hypothetical protein [Chloracidobacterium sp.]MDW8217999.1 hypothetical protein [Acidobacteriota bacterium]
MIKQQVGKKAAWLALWAAMSGGIGLEALGQTIQIGPVVTGAEDAQAQALPVGLAMSPDGAQLALGRGNVVSVSPVMTEAQVRAREEAFRRGVPLQPSMRLLADDAPVTSVAWSPDGQFLASGGGDEQEGEVVVRETKTWTEAMRLPHTDIVWSVAWSPDGRYLAAGSGIQSGEVVVWDVTTKTPAARLNHASPVTDIAWSPDGKRMATRNGDDRRGEVIIWATGDWREVSRPGGANVVTCVAWSPDGRHLAAGNWDERREHGEVLVWEFQKKPSPMRLDHTGIVRRIAWSPDGKHLAAWGGEIGAATATVWEVKRWRMTPTNMRLPTSNGSIVWSPDGKTLLIAGTAGNGVFQTRWTVPPASDPLPAQPQSNPDNERRFERPDWWRN